MIELSNNKKIFLNIFSTALIVYGLTALPSCFVAIFFNEDLQTIPLGLAAGLSIIGGFTCRRVFDVKATKVRPRMNFMTTIFTWLSLIAITTAVFYFGRESFSLADSLFEASASLTTTGAGIQDVSTYPYSLMLWRSCLNWIGGIGIILIAVSCLSEWKFSGHSLVSTEIPGPDFLKSSVTFRNTYRTIILVYAELTAIEFLLLMAFGMEPFTAILTSLSCISTAGLQHINNGLITGLSMPIKCLITLFSFIGSMNVSFFLLALNRKFKQLRTRTESSVYAGRTLLIALVIALTVSIMTNENLMSSYAGALMQTVSFLSTSGYIIADCGSWPLICKVILVLELFIGSCAVSTGGGIKMARADIAVRTIEFGLFRHIHPRAVKPIRFRNGTLKQEQLIRANLFIALFMLVYILGALILSMDNKIESIFDALNYSQAMLTNTGTSIADLAAPGLDGQLSALSKTIMSIEMLAGRLEIYPLLMLFSSRFWRSERS